MEHKISKLNQFRDEGVNVPLSKLRSELFRISRSGLRE